MRAVGGAEGYGRILLATSPSVAKGHLLVAFEANRNDSPWVNRDKYRRLNGVIRYSQGDAQNGLRARSVLRKRPSTRTARV